jgi:multimeric flavodoxin WrbA
MKVVGVLGSPRKKGNSSILANQVIGTLRESGASTEEFVLNRLTLRGCQGCEGCKSGDKCVLRDDMIAVLNAVKAADVVVMASPVYFGDVTGQFKCFFDRTYSFLDPFTNSRLAPGKKVVFILSQGDLSDQMHADIFPRYENWLKMIGFDEIYSIRAIGVNEVGEVNRKPDLLEQAENIGRKLAASPG